MGLLDDAIREHLELKRQAGADPTEVARQEKEALGPVVRGELLLSEPQVAQPAEDVLAHDDPEPDEHEHEPEPEPEPEHAAPAEHEQPAAHEEHPVEESSGLPASVGQPTEEYDVEADHAAADEKQGAHAQKPEQGHDVLEETPEFLEETPEHDRLWFEQAPPQEFDFDK
jgi:hypothetical protein